MEFQSGTVVQLNNGKMYIVVKCDLGITYQGKNVDYMLYQKNNKFMISNYYDSDLKHYNDKGYDVLRIFQPLTACGFNDILLVDMKLIWEREEKRVIEVSKGIKFVIDTYIRKGYKYLAKDEDGEVYLFVKKPSKSSTMWKDETFVQDFIFDDLSNLVSWKDKEPLNITKIDWMIKD